MNHNTSYTSIAKVVFTIAGILVGYVLLRLVVVPFKMTNRQMEPTIEYHDYVWFVKYKHVRPGTIVLYKSPLSGYLVGRIIARSGDTVEIVNKTIYINGLVLKPQWTIARNDSRVFPSHFVHRDNMPPLIVPDGKLFIISDNWDVPVDSRLFGAVSVNDIVGIYLCKLSHKNF